MVLSDSLVPKGGVFSSKKYQSDRHSLAVVKGQYVVGADNDGNLIQWRLNSKGLDEGKIIYKHLRNGEKALIRTLTSHEDLLAAGDAQGQIILFRHEGQVADIKSFLKLHKGFVSALSFNSKGDRLATGSLDGSVYLWNLREGFEGLDVGQIPLEIENRKQVFAVAFDDSDQFLVYGDKSQWHIRPIIASNLYEILTHQVVRVAHNER